MNDKGKGRRAGADAGTRAGGRAPLKSAYLILGDDMPKIELALRRLRARIADRAGTDLNIDEFDATGDAGSKVVNAANTLAFLGGTRLVLVRQAQAWLKTDKETVIRYLESPAPDACLALVAESLGPRDGLRLAMEKHGEVLEYRAPKEGQLPGWLMQQAAAMQLQLGMAEARLLVQRCGDNQNTLLRELEKLKAYAGDEPVRADDIRLLCSATVEASIFDLLDSLALGRGAETFAALDELVTAGERVEVLFYRILRNFQNLSRVAALRDEGLTQTAIQTEMKMKPYPVKKLMQQAALLGSDEIARKLGIIADTDARMKGMGSLPAEMELQLCLGRLLAN